jgi:HEAT repeat protein
MTTQITPSMVRALLGGLVLMSLATATSAAPAPGAEGRIAATGRLAMERNPANKEALLALLQDPEPLVRHHGVYGLQRLGDASAATAIRPLVKDSDPMVRRAAVIALGKLGAKETVPALLAALADEDAQVRREVLAALGHMGDPSSVQPVLAAAQDRTFRKDVGSALAVFLYQPFVPVSSATPLLKQLLDDGGARSTAAYVLARKCGDASGEDILIKGLEGSDFAQQTSAEALGLIKSRQAIPALVKCMTATGWTTTRKYAAKALGEIGVDDKAAREELQKLLTGENLLLRPVAAKALKQMGVAIEEPDLTAPAAEIPNIPADQLRTPGNKRPPQFICLAVDDNVNVEGLEAILDICEAFQAQGKKVVFTLGAAPLMGSPETRDMEKQKLLYQRLFDLGCEFTNHSLRHGQGVDWTALPVKPQIEEVRGVNDWLRENVPGFTRCFSWAFGGQKTRATAFWRDNIAPVIRQDNYLYMVNPKIDHPDEQTWPLARRESDEPGMGDLMYWVDKGCLDGTAPPVHKVISEKLNGADFPGRYDYEVPQGVAMLKSNFDYHYRHPRRPIFVAHFHDWALPARDWGSLRNEGAMVKAFLQEILVDHKDQYPETYSVTLRQVIEYSLSNGDLAHTLAVGNCQDSRNPKKPIIP